jgi:iron complex transport system substrate-binding protein
MDRKMILTVILALIIVSAGAFIVLNTGSNETAGPVTLTDAEGRNVTTAEAPLRIVSCSPSLTEIVYAMGIGDRLVAVTDYCNWPEDVNVRKDNGSLATMGGYFTPSIEAIVEADSDLVLVDKAVQAQLDMVPQMEDLELNVIVLHKGLTFEEVYQNIAMIGEICWEEERSDQLIESMQERLTDIQEIIGEVEDLPTVVFAVWLEPIYLSGNGTFSHEMMTLAMGENAYSDMTSWPEVGMESILERDPEYILVSMMWVPTTAEEMLQDLRNDTLWSETSAVQNNQVYIFTGQADNVFSRPGPRMVDGVEIMAKILHSVAFNVTMPNVIADDYVDWVSESASAEASAVQDSLSSSLNFLAQIMERRA